MRDLGRILSHHALDRYRKRIDPKATDAEAAEALAAARLQTDRPGDIFTAPLTEAWAVTRDAAFPLMVGRHDGQDVYIATTVLKRYRRSKADRRAWREQTRADRAWA